MRKYIPELTLFMAVAIVVAAVVLTVLYYFHPAEILGYPLDLPKR